MHKTDQVIYTPEGRMKVGLVGTWVLMFSHMYKYRELIWQLFKRDFLMAYKKSFIGVGWILISPIIGIISWVMLNATGILNPGQVDIPFPAYVLLSSSLWGLFMGFYGSAAATLGAGSGFIMQVNYPHETLLVKQTAQHLASFTITLVVNIVVLLVFGVRPSVGILLLPFLALPLFFLGAAIGLIVGIVSVVATDITNFVSMGFSFLFYLTPIIYSPDVSNPLLAQLVRLNPLTYLITGMRDVMLHGYMDDFGRYMLISAVSFVLFLISLRLFYVGEERIIEKMI